MTLLIKTLAAIAAGTVLATSAFAQSAREIRGPTPYFTVENEPAPKLIVDPALPGPLALGLVQINTGWRTCRSYRCSERPPSKRLTGQASA